MKVVLWTVGPGVVVLVAFWIGIRLARRKQEQRSEVTPAWINEHVYSRTGDDRQSK